jgi:glycosyltransferase involved in cell wall biosynthesis
MHADFDVLHVRSSAGLYGAEGVILGLLPALADCGVGGALLSLDNPYLERQPLADRADALGIRTERLPCRGRFDFATVAAMRRALSRHPDAIVHVHDYKSALVAWLARGRRPLPIVATSHGQFASTLSLQLYHRVELSLLRRFDRVGVVSEEMRPWLQQAGVAPARIVLVENGIDVERFSPQVAPLARSSLGIADAALVFGAAMRLTEQKDPLLLLDAFALLARETPHAVLAIAGDGPLREATRARADELGIGRCVHLLGARDDLERFYAMLDVFVLPSRYEGLPLALLEAMAMQRPVAATRVGQVADVLAGLPYQPVACGDAGALAAAMRAAPGRGATQSLRQRVVERYSVQRMARDYAALYRDVWRSRERFAA